MKTAVENRHCDFYKAVDGQWYLNQAPLVGGDYKSSDTYGPFDSYKDASEFLRKHLPNPGGRAKDITGRKPVPRRAPNGHPVKHPQTLVTPMPEAKVAARWMEKQAGQKPVVTKEDLTRAMKGQPAPEGFEVTYHGRDKSVVYKKIDQINFDNVQKITILTRASSPLSGKSYDGPPDRRKVYHRALWDRVAGIHLVAPKSVLELDMQIRSLRSISVPNSPLQKILVEGFIRFKIGLTNRVALMLSFDLDSHDGISWFPSNFDVRGLTGSNISFLLIPMLLPFLDQIVEQAKLEGLIQ